jgi:hypothetical protein
MLLMNIESEIRGFVSVFPSIYREEVTPKEL